MRTQRLLGVDAIKLVSFAAIVAFHSSYALWAASGYTDVPSNGGVPSQLVALYARSLSFSGFTIFGMTFFLMGNRKLANLSKPWLPVVMFVFWIGFNLLIREDLPFLLTWEVYPLILLALGTLWILERAGGRLIQLMGGLGFILLWIPFWKWEGRLAIPLGLEQALIGVCRNQMDLADWPILPWIGLGWFGYAAGKAVGGRHVPVRRIEGVVWAGLLLGSVAQWGDFFRTTVGYAFACSVFRMPPLVLWSHLIWPFAMIRFSLDPRVADRLQTIRLFRLISGLSLVRHFWLAYVIHYPMAFLSAEVLRIADLHFHPHALFIASLGVLVSTELLTRIVRLLLTRAPQPVIRDPLR